MGFDLSHTATWLAIGQIILIDILLGGDNAIVIALACRRLPPALRRQGIFWGVVGAVGARIVLIAFALHLLNLPGLKVTGAALLLWIGIKLMLPDDGTDHRGRQGGSTLWSAVRTVVVADAAMSLDNVIAVSAAAEGQLALVVLGILVSIPVIVWGSRLVLAAIDLFPMIAWLGAGLLGWIGGGLALSDALLATQRAQWPAWLPLAASVLGTAFVLAVGTPLRVRARRAAAT